jgi:hypothetical protein
LQAPSNCIIAAIWTVRDSHIKHSQSVSRSGQTAQRTEAIYPTTGSSQNHIAHS